MFSDDERFDRRLERGAADLARSIPELEEEVLPVVGEFDGLGQRSRT
jgi:hypothetical protein